MAHAGRGLIQAVRQIGHWLSDYQKKAGRCSYFVLDDLDRTTIIAASRIGERALSRTSRGGAGCDGTVAAAEALRVGPKGRFCATCKEARVTCGSRGRTAQGPSNATTLAFRQTAGGEVVLGVCKPLIRRVRSAGVKTTVHRCEVFWRVGASVQARQAAGSHNAHAFRTPFRGVLRK
jgi:hypothetical protein